MTRSPDVPRPPTLTSTIPPEAGVSVLLLLHKTQGSQLDKDQKESMTTARTPSITTPRSHTPYVQHQPSHHNPPPSPESRSILRQTSGKVYRLPHNSSRRPAPALPNPALTANRLPEKRVPALFRRPLSNGAGEALAACRDSPPRSEL